MPNWVTNQITAKNEVIKALIGKDEDGKPCVDFNLIVPRPPEISEDGIPSNVESAAQISLGLIDFQKAVFKGSLADEFKKGNYETVSNCLHTLNCIKQLNEGKMVKDFTDSEFDLFVNYLKAYRKYGLMTWYDWNIKYWGTKWNACECKIIGDDTVRFETAWSAPHPVIAALHLKFPKEKIIHKYADEDVGRNCGIVEYGERHVKPLEFSKKKEGYEIAFELGVADKSEYKLVGDKYKHIER